MARAGAAGDREAMGRGSRWLCRRLTCVARAWGWLRWQGRPWEKKEQGGWQGARPGRSKGAEPRREDGPAQGEVWAEPKKKRRAKFEMGPIFEKRV